MPKEQIIHPTVCTFDKDGKQLDEGRLTYVDEPPEGGRKTITNGFAVSWSKETYGQVVIEIPLGVLENLLEEIKKDRIRPEFGMVKFYTDINRAQMNGLIQSTRRMRNQVYGADE